MHAGREDLGKGSLGFEECRVVFINVILLLHEDLCDIGECQVILHGEAVAVIMGHQGKVWEHREDGGGSHGDGNGNGNGKALPGMNGRQSW